MSDRSGVPGFSRLRASAWVLYDLANTIYAASLTFLFTPWLKERVGARWVTGVLCVAGDLEPREEGRGWVVGATRLAGWLQTQSNQRMDPDVVRRRLLEG